MQPRLLFLRQISSVASVSPPGGFEYAYPIISVAFTAHYNGPRYFSELGDLDQFYCVILLVLASCGPHDTVNFWTVKRSIDAENMCITLLPAFCFCCFFHPVMSSVFCGEIFARFCTLGPGLVVYSLFAVRGVMIFGNQTRPDLINNLHAPWMGDSAQPVTP